MTNYYEQVRVVIDPQMSEQLSAGGILQDVSLILVDRARGPETLRAAAITLAPDRARELAFELLGLAEAADRLRTRP